MEAEVVPVAGLFERFVLDVEPLGDRQSIAKRGQFQHRQVVAAAIEADERGALIVLPTAPKQPRNGVGAIAGGVERYQIQQPIFRVDLGDCDGGGDHIRHGENVLAVTPFGEDLVAKPSRGVARRESVLRVFHPRDEVAVGDGFDVEHEIARTEGVASSMRGIPRTGGDRGEARAE